MAPAFPTNIWPFYLMVSPQASQSVGIHYPEYFGFLVFPSDEVFVPAVGEQLVDVIPKQSTVYRGKGRVLLTRIVVETVTRFQKRVCNHSLGLVSTDCLISSFHR